jgi:hypothetical protein
MKSEKRIKFLTLDYKSDYKELILTKLKLVDTFNAGRDRNAKFNNDTARFLSKESNNAGVDVCDAVLVEDADNVTHLLV